MHKGWITFLSGNVKEASAILVSAKMGLESEPNDNKRSLLKGQLSALLATLTALTRDLDGAIDEAKEAIANLPDDELIYLARALRAWGVSLGFQGKLDEALDMLNQAANLALDGKNRFLAAEILSQVASIRKHQGLFTQAEGEYDKILGLFDQPDQEPPACLGYIGKAEIALEIFDLTTAEEFLNRGVQLCQLGNIGYALQPAYLIGGLIKCVQGDLGGAMESIQQGEALSQKGGGSLESILGLASFQTRLNLACGETEQAKDWATGKSLSQGWSFVNLPNVLAEVNQSILARVNVSLGKYSEVIRIADDSIGKAENGGRFARVREFALYKAIALHELGNDDEALGALRRSLEISEPENAALLYLEMGEPVFSLLKLQKELGKESTFSQKLMAEFYKQAAGVDSESTRSIQDSLVEKLTTRELEILRLMCEGQPNQQIADALVVSINTVKKHTSNIYGKLGVKNRTQALIRVGELDLI